MDAFRFFNRAQGTMRDRVATQPRPKRLLRLFLAFLIGAVSVLPLPGLTPPAAAAAFVVNSTGDSGDLAPGNGLCDTGALNSESNAECTLRAAIEETNALAGADSVDFNIPTNDPGYLASPLSYTITPTSNLVNITETVSIDATTQPDHPGTPIIVLDGSGAGAADGITVSANDSTIRGLVVMNFADDGIQIDGNNNTIVGNYVGVDVSGAAAQGNDDGILVFGTNNIIGGPAADRNVVGVAQVAHNSVASSAEDPDALARVVGDDVAGASGGAGSTPRTGMPSSTKYWSRYPSFDASSTTFDSAFNPNLVTIWAAYRFI